MCCSPARKAHECHCQQSGSNQSYRSTLHTFRYTNQAHLLAQACKQCQCQAETKCRRECINHSRQQIIIFLDNKDSHTENTAVGSNQRQEHAQGLIQRRRNFLQDNLYHLHQCGNHQNKGNSLQIAQIKSVEHILLNKECHDSGDGEHECHRCRHAQCSLHFLGNSQERANSQELRQYDVVYKDCRDKYQYIFHNH